MPDVKFDTFYRYDDLTQILHSYAEEYPHLVRVNSIGHSYEGRDIWLVTVTNTATGPDTEKPALWIDGNIHASEVSPSTACLYHLHTLVTQYGSQADITRCLDTRVFYICPRINPDGAEWALADKPKIIRSSTRPHPYDEEAIEGLLQEDVDGDGRMLSMRLPDPNGPWKICLEEPRLMVRRDAIETDGQYYRLLPEGTIENYNGAIITMQPNKQGLDINRNFPADWRQEKDQPGAGPYPVSEPEVQAVVDFIARHRNITGGIALHTFSGVLLRPYSHKADEAFPAEDLWTYQKMGAKGTQLTGYPNISIFHEFRYHPRQVITGGMDVWMYDHLGCFFWAIEIWSPQKQAGIEEYKYIDWYREHSLDDDLKMLKWSDEQLDGQGYSDWYAFDHPQLGPVELGGWDISYAIRNPPPKFMEAEMARFPEWFTWQLLISPLLELYHVGVTPIGEGVYGISLVVHNTGWLPTYVTKKALEAKTVRGVICEIELPEGATLRSGKIREEVGQLEGRAYKPSAPAFLGMFGSDATQDRAMVEWVVHAPQGGTVQLTARHDRAGTIRAEVTL